MEYLFLDAVYESLRQQGGGKEGVMCAWAICADGGKAMRCFQDDWEACVAYLRCPAIHHKRIRTTNLLERSFLEERRRTRTISRFFLEKSCLKLVFATRWRVSQRWQGIRMSEIELQQLRLLRRELGQIADE